LVIQHSQNSGQQTNIMQEFTMSNSVTINIRGSGINTSVN